MDKENIKKALEHCVIHDCSDSCIFSNKHPFACLTEMHKQLLTLINELESENESLQRDFVVKAYDKLRAENRQLRNRLKNTQSAMQDWDKLIEKFKENAKQRVCGENLDGLVLAIRILQDIREKGLLGGEDNGST